MIYPKFLSEHAIIGICAPSAGVGHKIESFEDSLKVLRAQGWKIWETEHVRVDDLRGGEARQRAEELMSLFSLDAVDAVFSAAGGDFLSEILPYIDWQLLAEHPKWLMGASDPTGILYPMTTICDVATLYGSNGGSFDATVPCEAPGLSDSGQAVETLRGQLPDYLRNMLRFLKGDLPVQESGTMFLGSDIFRLEGGPMVFNQRTVYQSNRDQLNVKGRCIGGCIDVLKDLIGTRFDHTAGFIERYRHDGFIWYFDNFALSTAVLYRTLLQLRYAGWITPETTRAVLIGRTLFENVECDMTYPDAFRAAFPDIPVIWDMDIGHTVPHFSMINGAMLDVVWNGTKARLCFELS